MHAASARARTSAIELGPGEGPLGEFLPNVAVLFLFSPVVDWVWGRVLLTTVIVVWRGGGCGAVSVLVLVSVSVLYCTTT